MLVEGRGKQDVSRGGGANRMFVEGEGQTGCSWRERGKQDVGI